MRAGFESIPRGQIEAAEWLALSRRQVYWHVVLLPAVERVYPALTSQFVLLMLASSVMLADLGRGADRGRQLHPVGYLSAPSRPTSSSPCSTSCCRCVMRAGFWASGRLLFPRRRRLGTPL